MNVILFGATGMVGQGVLRECLLDPKVNAVLSIGRRKTGQTHAKLREIIHRDLLHLTSIESSLPGFDACLFCLGISSFQIAEEEYRRVTYDLTLAIAQTLARINPAATFLYVSSKGTDSSEGGRRMWARVKGRTENALFRLPFRAAVMFRPGFIIPLKGIIPKTSLYRILYSWIGPVGPLFYKAFPWFVTTTEQLGRAMIRVAASSVPKTILTNKEINAF